MNPAKPLPHAGNTPLVAGTVPPPSSPLKKRGRPKGSINKPKRYSEKPNFVDKKIEKAKIVLERMTQDVVTLSEPAFDGGGTMETAPGINKDSLERRVARRLNVLDRYLTDERLTALLSVSGLKEVGVYEGIMMDKALILKGQPTVIVGSEDRHNMDTVLPKLLNEIRRRKLITSVTERKMEFTDAGEM